MNVIAKMRCTSLEDYGYSRKIKLGAVHDSHINTSAEDRSFTKATPSGECWMTVDNQLVWPAFQVPKRVESETGYYIDYEAASTHYVLFIDAKEHTLGDVHRALAALETALDNA